MASKFTQVVRSRGFSITRLSVVSGVSLTTVSTLGRGEREFKNITVENATKMADALGLTVNELYSLIYQTDPLD